MFGLLPHWTSIDHWLAHFNLTGKERLLHELRHHISIYDDAIPALEQLSRNHQLILFTANDETLAPSRYGSWKKDRRA